MDGVGFTNTFTTIGLPLEIPPLIPPLLFVSVLPSLSMILSLNSDPFKEAPEKPTPNSIPLTPPTENIK